MDAMLHVDGVTKRYGARTALDTLSFMLPRGVFAALLGPNGAGKTTLFQVLTGLFAADAGDVAVGGRRLRREPVAVLRQLGVVFQQPSLDLDLNVRRNLLFQADLQGLPRAAARERIEQGCAAFGIGAELARTARELSGGTRRKVELLRALLHQPALLLMDEPTVGLDPKSRRDLLGAIRQEVAARGTTVLWATHLVEEAHEADRVLVLHRGKLVADDTPAAIAATAGGTLEAAFLRATAQ